MFSGKNERETDINLFLRFEKLTPHQNCIKTTHKNVTKIEQIIEKKVPHDTRCEAVKFVYATEIRLFANPNFFNIHRSP